MNLTKLVTGPRADALYCTPASSCPLTPRGQICGLFSSAAHIATITEPGTPGR